MCQSILDHHQDHEKVVEILLLQRQLAILQRQNKQVVRPQRDDKFVLATLAHHLKTISNRTTTQLQSFVSIVRPEAVLRWHREIVRRKWIFNTTPPRGRPAIEVEVETLIIRLARENDWGYGKIIGELRKLGFHIRKQSVANILKQNGIPPLPKHQPSLSFQHLMTHYKNQLLACDFFTVESLFLQTIYVYFFIEIGRRTVHFAGCTTAPNKAWVTQQARHLIWKLDEQEQNMRFLIHDHDKKFTQSFDAVFVSEHIDIILTPYQAPNANAFAERWVRSVREECLENSSFSIKLICNRSCTNMSTTTTAQDLIRELSNKYLSPQAQNLPGESVAVMCWVGSFMITIVT